MNDASRSLNPGAGKPKRAPAGSRGPEQAYPDPPRSWTRASILLGGWVAAWAGVLVFGMGLQAVAQAQGEEPVLPGDSHAAVAAYFDQIFVYRDLADAEALQCADYNGPSPTDLLGVVETWESENDSRSSVATVDVIEDGDRHKVTVTYGEAGSPTAALFWGNGAQDGDSYCVTEVSERESEPEPDEPDPEESPGDGPGARETVSDFLAAIFRDQDQQAAASLQCSEYDGIPLVELLEIRSDHVHEGAGSTLYDLELEPRAHDDPQETTDLFHAIVELDDAAHEFMVTFDPAEQQKCVASVSEG